MQTNQAGLELIKEFEGFQARTYRCPAGVLTIGYGHTSMAGAPIVKPDMIISKADAETILRHDLKKYEQGVIEAMGDSLHHLNENQFSAMVSLCYNIGPGNLKKSSVVRHAKAFNMDKARDSFKMWNKGGGRVLKGLVRRRAAEAKLWDS